MDIRKIKILELVEEINEKGGNLVAKFSKENISVFDADAGCEEVFELKADTVFVNYIYTSNRWKKYEDSFYRQAIEQLEERLK